MHCTVKAIINEVEGVECPKHSFNVVYVLCVCVCVCVCVCACGVCVCVCVVCVCVMDPLTNWYETLLAQYP